MEPTIEPIPETTPETTAGTTPDWLAGRFEEHRGHLRAVGYRMLGSLSEADDALQETWLRLSRADTSDVANLGGWLTTVMARVCLNILRSRRTRKEDPLPVHTPDPVVGLAQRPEHAVADGAQVPAVLLEAAGEIVLGMFGHGRHVPPSAGVRQMTRRTPPV